MRSSASPQRCRMKSSAGGYRFANCAKSRMRKLSRTPRNEATAVMPSSKHQISSRKACAGSPVRANCWAAR
ncbi:MAG: hypothetical protein B9S34_03180 [Opitutia bacterium Tous-C1TDCM]|nr:MAG: hypothetical protein B9S34_03180 [Opitutae bacterium Tous-C1TDCM]